MKQSLIGLLVGGLLGVLLAIAHEFADVNPKSSQQAAYLIVGLLGGLMIGYMRSRRKGQRD